MWQSGMDQDSQPRLCLLEVLLSPKEDGQCPREGEEVEGISRKKQQPEQDLEAKSSRLSAEVCMWLSIRR